MRLKDKGYYDHIEHALNNHFPKGKSKERSQGLMLFSTAVMAHSRIMDKVRKHMAYLLSVTREEEKVTQEYSDARTFFTQDE